MKIKKPIMPALLEPTDQLLPLVYEAKREDIDIAAQHFKDVTLNNKDLTGLCFSGVTFENCRLIDCVAPKCNFTDVIFKSCDLSNTNFSDGYFNRCEFVSCKLMGANFYNNSLRDTSVANCNGKYLNLYLSVISAVTFTESDLSDVNFTECKLKSVEFIDVELTKAVFFKTPLKGIDFTKSRIDGIIVSANNYELVGAIVTTYQAAELAKLLGVIVK